MATLQSTSVDPSVTASTSFTSPKQFVTLNNQRFREYTYNGAAVTISTNGGFVYLLGNTGVHERMYGYLTWWSTSGFFGCGAVRFQLSEYGLSYVTLVTQNDSWSMERYNPSYGTNYIKFINLNGTHVPSSNYYFNVRVSGMGGFSYVSDYLTTQIR